MIERYVCDNCYTSYENIEDKACDCGNDDNGYIKERRCSTCWEWRDDLYYLDSFRCCRDCRVHAKTIIRLGIITPDEIIQNISLERVRGRNAVLQEAVPVSQIELRKGKIIGETQTVWREPVVWNEYEKEWQVVDEAEAREIWLSESDNDHIIQPLY